ncbi:hypothetical protein P346_03959 [Enterobacter sp. DC1]|nr:hypothetical protein P346_03959 [Enterobacter sp. DC1]
MPQKVKAVISMGDSGLIHVQPEFQAVFEYATTSSLMVSAYDLVPLTMMMKSSE